MPARALQFPRPANDHESWFEERYDQLLAWAMQITGGDREQGEDLVHDVFVQFMARRPGLTAIENPDGYLYTSLRHHHLANVRRAARMRETVTTDGFDLLAHESLPQGWRAWRAHHMLGDDRFAQQLCDVWRYTQYRKGTAKTAIVLLMRFFHGYYPGEIARVLRLSRPTVGQLLHLARKEARLFMADPDAAAPAPPDTALFAPVDLALALRDAALCSGAGGACRTEAEIAALYREPGNASLATATVAHLVSCAACLDRANRVLGLPPLADRHPLDTLGYERDERPPRDGSNGSSGPGGPGGSGGSGRPGGGGSGAGGGARGGAGGGSARTSNAARQSRRRALDEGRRKLTDVLDHRPHELRIAVNGIVLGSQTITAAVSRQTFRVAQQPFDFIEVLSEQEVRLLLLSVEAPPRGPADIHDAVTLSDGRRLEVRIDFASDIPDVHVSYVDQALFECPVRARVPSPTLATEPDPPSASDSVIGRTLTWLRHLAHPAPWGSAEPRPASSVPTRKWRLMRGAVTSLLVAAALGGWLLYQGQSVLSAAAMLERSRAADALSRASEAVVVHRTLDIESRSAIDGATIRRRVEVWRSSPRGLTVRRAYDEQGHLLAGEWIEAHGKRTVHHRRTTAGAQPMVRGLEAWRMEPSADDFIRIAGDIDRAVVRDENDRHVIDVSARNNNTAAAPDILSASLTLRDDWRAIELFAVMRSAAGGETTVSWRERTRSTMGAERAPAGAFELDAAFVPGAAASPAPGAGGANAHVIAITPATASLEIAALAALRRIDADLGEEVRVERANGRLAVTGIVASAQRRAQILSVLAAVRREPAARIRIETLDEVHARARARRMTPRAPAPAASPDDTSIEPRGTGVISLAPARIALHDEVRASLIAAGVSAAAADDEVARTADRIIRRAQVMRLHAWALRRVFDGVSEHETEAMTGDGRAQWRALIREHARAFLDEAAALSVLVRPVLADAAPGRENAAASGDAPGHVSGSASSGSASSGSASSGSASGDAAFDDRASGDRTSGDRALRAYGRALVEHAARLDALVQAAFMLPVNGATPIVPAPAAFWLSHRHATAAASSLERAAHPPSSRP